MSQIKRGRYDFLREHGRFPSDGELAERVGYPQAIRRASDKQYESDIPYK